MKKISLALIAVFLLSACTGKWNKPAEITQELKKQYETTVAEFEFKIKNYQPDDVFNTPEPPIPFWVELARAQEGLGLFGDALETYEKAKEIYPRSEAIENNIGRIYEAVGEYEMAVAQYQYIFETFQDSDYLYDIARVYIDAKDRKNAEKFFNAWQLANQTTDAKMQQDIKKLREEEKANQEK